MIYFAGPWKIFLLLILLLSHQSTSSPLAKRGPTCYDFDVPVTISATNFNIPPSFTLDSILNPFAILEGLFGFVLNLFVTGSYSISARYCEPEVVIESRTNTLQILVHGATYTKNYWSGDGPPGAGYDGDTYSWIAYASQRGYPTLSIDRLGNGASEHPDPITVVQVPAGVEIIHSLIAIVKDSGPSNPLPRAFDKIVYAGHSYGSITGNELTVKYPNDVDTIVLTGFSKYVTTAFPGVLANAVPLPANVVDPTRFGTLAPGYLQATNEAGIIWAFFYDGPAPNGYDHAFQRFDWKLRGTISLGEAATGFVTTAIAPSSSFTGPVMVITGQKDQIFCNPTGTALTPGDCGGVKTGLLAQTATLYPRASSYYSASLPDAGHCWQLHRNAQVGFGMVHDWLESVGF